MGDEVAAVSENTSENTSENVPAGSWAPNTAKVLAKLAASYKAAIEAGTIVLKPITRKISAKASGTGQEVEYESLEVEIKDQAGALGATEGKSELIWKALSQVESAGFNALLRTQTLRDLEKADPNFARNSFIEKTVATLVKAGKSEDVARRKAEKAAAAMFDVDDEADGQ